MSLNPTQNLLWSGQSSPVKKILIFRAYSVDRRGSMPGQFGVICPELLEILPLIRVRRSFKDSHKGPARLRLELEARDRLNGPPVHNGHTVYDRL